MIHLTLWCALQPFAPVLRFVSRMMRSVSRKAVTVSSCDLSFSALKNIYPVGKGHDSKVTQMRYPPAWYIG